MYTILVGLYYLLTLTEHLAHESLYLSYETMFFLILLPYIILVIVRYTLNIVKHIPISANTCNNIDPPLLDVNATILM
jgi:hypothetical protein